MYDKRCRDCCYKQSCISKAVNPDPHAFYRPQLRLSSYFIGMSTSSSVTFSVQCDSTQWGESVGVLGSFNQWDKSSFMPLSTNENDYPKWSASIDVNSKEVEYKYVILKDNQICRWETNSKNNRYLKVSSSKNKVFDVFGDIRTFSPSQVTKDHKFHDHAHANQQQHYDENTPNLDALEKALVHTTNAQRSWRQRLQFVRSLFTDETVQKQTNFSPTSTSLPHLTTLAIYLQFLSTGYIPCAEDGGHHRPNHHAYEAQILDMKLSSLSSSSDSSFLSYVVRKILPYLPSYSSQFMVSVPLTRIRDIAHRSDIPKDLKLDIKHNLQNKLHRCAGPEDLHTSQRILNQISHGGYSHPFVEQFKIFHEELKQFFNQASLDEHLEFLIYVGVNSAGDLLRMKRENVDSFRQLEQVVRVRNDIADLPFMNKVDGLPEENVQKARLADIEIESYTFILLAALAKETENGIHDMNRIVSTISCAMQMINLNGIQKEETQSISNEFNSILHQEDNEMIRLHAAIERSLRFLTHFSDTIFSTFDSRVHSLGNAFQVEQRVTDVFAEAEIRASIVFQASRVVSALSAHVKRTLRLPLWNALNTGSVVCEQVVYVKSLSDAKASKNTIVICEECDGEEEVDENILGVITGIPIPQLSHLGVRVRQAGVVFVCAEERSVFDEAVWNSNPRVEGKCVLKVNDTEGLVELRKFDNAKDGKIGETESDDKQIEKETENGELTISIDENYKEIIRDIRDSTKERVSSKAFIAGSLLKIADDSNELFKASEGVAIPHGMFQYEVDQRKDEYKKLVAAYHESKSNEMLKKIQRWIQTEFEVSSDEISVIQSVLEGKKVMVRSSANAEDLENLSGAGLYDTVANVDADEENQLVNAIKSVWASIWSERAATSRMKYNVKDDLVSMAVLIQVMIFADLSFVAFSHDPVQSKQFVYIEMACGMGETLASAAGGAGSPYRFRVDRTSLDVVTVALASYSNALVPDEKDEGLKKSVIDYSHIKLTADKEWRVALVRRIAKSVLLLEKNLGAPQDVEGCVLQNKNETDLYVVQSRPQIL